MKKPCADLAVSTRFSLSIARQILNRLHFDMLSKRGFLPFNQDLRQLRC